MTWTPFSLLSIAGACRRREIDVIIHDANRSSDGAWETLLEHHAGNALAIGVSLMTGGGQIGDGLRLIERARARSSCPPIIVGGPHANVLATEMVADDRIDWALQGPGQQAMPAMVAALTGQAPFGEVPGLVGKDRQPPRIANPSRSGHLDRYPLDLLDLSRYIAADPTIGPRTLGWVSSQGCAYRCRFCYETVHQRRWSAQDGDGLVEDLSRLITRHELSGIKFYDADFFIRFDRAEAVTGMLADRHPGFSWAASINPRDVLRAERMAPGAMRRLRRSGCSRLLMGVESGNDRVLREVIDKQVTRAEAEMAMRAIADAGIVGAYTFIVGFPGETPEEIDDTLRFAVMAARLEPRPDVRVHIYAPYPGTPLYGAAINAGFVPPTSLAGWSDVDYYTASTPWVDQRLVERSREATRQRAMQPEESSLP